jgi:hypothetical protein
MPNRLHTGGVTGSIPVAPTTKTLENKGFSDTAPVEHPAVPGGTSRQPAQSRGQNPGTMFARRSDDLERLLARSVSTLPAAPSQLARLDPEDRAAIRPFIERDMEAAR